MPLYNPFGKKTQLEFVPVGTPETGIIYLLKRKLKVRENPVDAQESNIKQADLLALIGTAALRLAESKEVSEEEARGMLFPKIVEGVEIAAQENLTKWLSTEESSKYYQLLVTTAPRTKVATLFIQNRLGFHVSVVADAKAKATSLFVEPLRWDLGVNDIVEFEGFRVQLTEPANAGDEEISVKPLPQKLEAGAIGFLVDFQTNQKKVGIATWNESHTEDLDEEQVSAIYEFYQREIGLPVVSQPAEDEGNEKDQEVSGKMLPNSESLPIQSRSTGSSSGSELTLEVSASV